VRTISGAAPLTNIGENMRKHAAAMMLLGILQIAHASDKAEYTRWMKVEKLGPSDWRATCFNEIRGIDPKAEYQTRLWIQPPYFTAYTPEGMGIVNRWSPKLSQSGNPGSWSKHWDYIATLKGNVLQQTMSFDFTMNGNFDEPQQYHYLLCQADVTNLNTGMRFPTGMMEYIAR
jgi:hypothetical protein